MQDSEDKKPASPEADGANEPAGEVPAESDAASGDHDAGLEHAGDGESDSRDARIAELETALTEANDQKMRALADAENTRRRAQREREDAAKYGAVGLARDLLNIADNLSRAIAAAPEDAQDPGVKGLIEGISMVEKELASVLERHQVRPVPGVGEPFDHNVHQAVVELPTEEVEPGKVAQVLQTGYVLHDRLLRPAMVAVAKAP